MSSKYKAGDRVEADYNADGNFFLGTITNVNLDATQATYEISYDDGASEKAVPEGLVREPGSSGDSPTFDEGQVVWAKIKSNPWWPAVFFKTWSGVQDWELPVDMLGGTFPPVPKNSCVVRAMRGLVRKFWLTIDIFLQVYFLGNVVMYGVVAQRDHCLRNFAQHLETFRWPQIKSTTKKENFETAVEEVRCL